MLETYIYIKTIFPKIIYPLLTNTLREWVEFCWWIAPQRVSARDSWDSCSSSLHYNSQSWIQAPDFGSLGTSTSDVEGHSAIPALTGNSCLFISVFPIPSEPQNTMHWGEEKRNTQEGVAGAACSLLRTRTEQRACSATWASQTFQAHFQFHILCFHL